MANLAGYTPMMKAGGLRNGAERGYGSVFHAVPERDDKPGVPVYDNATALCGQYPANMWSSWRPKGQEITCPKCLKKIEKIKAESRSDG